MLEVAMVIALLVLAPGKVSWTKSGIVLTPWWKVVFLSDEKKEVKDEQVCNDS